MKRNFLTILFFLPIAVLAQDLGVVASSASDDLQKSLNELTIVRQEIEAERLPLARRVAELEQRLAERRVDFTRAETFQGNQLVELNALKAEARQRGDEVKFVESLLSEYTRAFRSRLNFVEEPQFEATLRAVEDAATAADLASAERITRRVVLLMTALKRSETTMGGEIIEGKALDRMGRVLPGKVAVLGPVAVFSAASGGSAGVLQQELNRADPTIIELEENMIAGSRALVSTGTGELLFDPTLGTASKLAAMEESLYEQLEKGGLIMIPLVGLGVVALLLGIVKWTQFSRVRLATEDDLQTVLRLLESREHARALAHARAIPGIAGNLLATAVEHSDEKKEYIEEVLYEKMLGARAKLERGLAFLALAATTGPLMGLLGTVMGMIATFKVISSFGSGDPKILADGISEALICTATGMAVAIPSLLFHAFLSRKAKGIIGSMEQTSVGFINGVPDENRREEKQEFVLR